MTQKETLPYTVTALRTRPALSGRAAAWFADKWGIPAEEYRSSMELCTAQAGTKKAVPQWYLILDDDENILAGAGIIENDFHDRRDLSPNLCALYVEEEHRGRGMARALLDFARRDMGKMGVERLYLVTDHNEFYEKCGWRFLTMVHDEGGMPERMYEVEPL